MLLVTDDNKVRELAEAAFARVGAIGGAADRAELKEKEKEFESGVLEFVAAAGRFLRGRESPVTSCKPRCMMPRHQGS